MYTTLQNQYAAKNNNLKNSFNAISILRLITTMVFFACLYYYFKTDIILFLIANIVTIFIFTFLTIWHKNIGWQKKIAAQLLIININEQNFLNYNYLPTNNGHQFIDAQHLYSYDLDIFGPNSLYHNFNRASTYIGAQKLADAFKTLLNPHEIIYNQNAIKELTLKITWRQNFLALGCLANDNEGQYKKLIQWVNTETKKLNIFFKVIIYAIPLLFFVGILLFFITNNIYFKRWATIAFFTNLFILISQLGKIKLALSSFSNIANSIKHYGLIIKKIEDETFEAAHLIKLQNGLKSNGNKASAALKKLAAAFKKIDGISNPLAAIPINGSMLYHLHAFFTLQNWKKNNALHLKNWLNIIGEFEALNCLANFSFNNKNFIYPALNNSNIINFTALGHPLIKQKVRVCNNVSFNPNKFIILTGSNMSGKSTFLRTLGVNMVLAGMGAPVCALSASIHPLQVIVSMRQTDSLTNSESYFFAEIKRLKQIMYTLNTTPCFVLLDEILKGTNSDDKQMGTIGVLKKMAAKNTQGVMATHDLEVCTTVTYYPKNLVNNCFEVEIVNNELVFDYMLKEGICKNKSATFLLNKFEII